MKILHVHNYHLGRGGMEVIYDSTTKLFRERGDTVIELSRDSADLKTPLARLGAIGTGFYSPAAARQTRDLIAEHHPDVAYVHNLYPMLSTSVLDACHAAGVPTVMDVQDYKLTCPMGQHIRDGKICTKCLDGTVAWSAVHACKGGRLTSAAYALTHGVTRWRGAYQRGIDLFATPARFVANHLVAAGFDRNKIEIVPNMCDLRDNAPASGDGAYAAFVGRISPEKGLAVLVEAARIAGIPVKIAGKGEIPGLKESAPANVEFVGGVPRDRLSDFYRGARFLVVPSVWNEVFCLVLMESMTLGIPAIASNTGGLPEIFEHERSGLHVPPSDPQALAAAMRRLWDDPAMCRRMGQAARAEALARFTPDAYYNRLKNVFDRAINEHRQPADETSGRVPRNLGVSA
jgi:glycosyltransferase involved in cell wall biosynthesis